MSGLVSGWSSFRRQVKAFASSVKHDKSDNLHQVGLLCSCAFSDLTCFQIPHGRT